MPSSPRFTKRPSEFHVLNPATLVASGFWRAISMMLPKAVVVESGHRRQILCQNLTLPDSSASTRRLTASLVRLLISSNFIAVSLLPVSACFLFHLTGSEKKQTDTGEGTERSWRQGGRA